MQGKTSKNLTLREFLRKKGIKLKKIESIGYTTLRNIIRWGHDWLRYNDKYKWRLPYYPTDKTVEKLSWELGITKEETHQLINKQYIANKKALK